MSEQPTDAQINALKEDRIKLADIRAEIQKAKTLPAFELPASSTLGNGVKTISEFLKELPAELPTLLEPSHRTLTAIIAWGNHNLETKRTTERKRDELAEERKIILRTSIDFGKGVTELRKKFEREGTPTSLSEILPALEQDFEETHSKRLKTENDLRDSRELHDRETNRRIELEKENNKLLEQIQALQKTVETTQKEREDSEDELQDVREALEEIFGEDKKQWPNGESIKRAWQKHQKEDLEKKTQHQKETEKLLKQISTLTEGNCPKPSEHQEITTLQKEIKELQTTTCPKPQDHQDIKDLKKKNTEYRSTTVEAGVALQTAINKNTALQQELEKCFSLLPGVTTFEQLSSAIHGLQNTEDHATNLVGELQATLFDWEDIGLILVPTADGRPPSIADVNIRVTQLINAFVGSNLTRPTTPQ